MALLHLAERACVENRVARVSLGPEKVVETWRSSTNDAVSTELGGPSLLNIISQNYLLLFNCKETNNNFP